MKSLDREVSRAALLQLMLPMQCHERMKEDQGVIQINVSQII